MSARSVALDHYRDRQRLIRAIARLAREAWQGVDPRRIDASWRVLLPRLSIAFTGAQQAAAQGADRYLNAVLGEQGIGTSAGGRVIASALSGTAADGRPLDTLLEHPTITARLAIRAGATPPRALAVGHAHLDMIVRTEIADAGRLADQIATAAHSGAEGYTRLAVGKTCSRCLVLAGKWYEWNAGFDRHPRCDCIHVPGSRATNDVRSNPRTYFDSLSRAEQDRTFTVAGAEAIRHGADIGQVVNARRGMQTAGVRGRRLQVTTEGTTTRGFAGMRLGARRDGIKREGDRYRSARRVRLMPEQIFREARGNRDETLRLLRLHGYLI